MAKVTCESCGTSFLYNVVKDMKNCPVCGKPLWDEEIENDGSVDVESNADESENGLIYFDEIMIFEERPSVLTC